MTAFPSPDPATRFGPPFCAGRGHGPCPVAASCWSCFQAAEASFDRRTSHLDDGNHGLVSVADTEAHRILLAVVNEQFPERVAPLHKGRVTDFNDAAETTWADVELVFEKAIAEAEVSHVHG
jgi:hypothetical protein